MCEMHGETSRYASGTIRVWNNKYIDRTTSSRFLVPDGENNFYSLDRIIWAIKYPRIFLDYLQLEACNYVSN